MHTAARRVFDVTRFKLLYQVAQPGLMREGDELLVHFAIIELERLRVRRHLAEHGAEPRPRPVPFVQLIGRRAEVLIAFPRAERLFAAVLGGWHDREAG